MRRQGSCKTFSTSQLWLTANIYMHFLILNVCYKKREMGINPLFYGSGRTVVVIVYVPGVMAMSKS
jgi:hypothetical protein